MAISFRERKGIEKWFGKTPLATLNIGDPIFPDKDLPTQQAIDKMHAKAYKDMQALVGIFPGDPTYNENQNIDEYKKTM